MARPEAPMHLWEEYLGTDEVESKMAYEDIVYHYQYLVEAIARKLQHRLPSFLEDAELISSGQLGLLRAINRYDPEAGPFSRYASTVIWGSIIDGLRAADFAPSSLRRQQRDMDAAVKKLRDSGAEDPTPEEIAEEMDTTEESVREIQYKVQKAEVAPTDPVLMPARQNGTVGADVWEREMCREFVVWLKEKDILTQKVVVLKYWKMMSLKNIATVLDQPVTSVRDRHQKVLAELLPFMVDLASD